MKISSEPLLIEYIVNHNQGLLKLNKIMHTDAQQKSGTLQQLLSWLTYGPLHYFN